MSRLLHSSRLALWMLGFSATLFLVSLVLFLILGSPQERVVRKLTGGSDRGEQVALTKYLRSHGGQNCAPFVTSADRTDTYLAGVRSIASVGCDAVGTGADRVSAHRFDTDDDLAAWESDQRAYLGGNDYYGTCEGSPGHSAWERGGRIVGRIFCEPGTQNQIAWSDRRSRTAYFAESDSENMFALLTWWHRHIRKRPVANSDGLRAIRETFSNSVIGGMDDCDPFPHPLADSALHCREKLPAQDPDTYVDDFSMYHFRSSAQLDEYFDNTQRQFRAPTAPSATYCDKGALVSSTFGSGHEVRGSILCYPSGTSQFLVWTIDAKKLAASIRRGDRNVRELYAAWRALP